MANSVPNPSRCMLAFPFTPQVSLLHFAWGEPGRELSLVPPYFFHVCGRIASRIGEKKKETRKANKRAQGLQAKHRDVRKHGGDARTGQVDIIFPHVCCHFHPTQETMAVSVPSWAQHPLPAEQLAKSTESNPRACLAWTYMERTLPAFLVDREKLCDLQVSKTELSRKL